MKQTYANGVMTPVMEKTMAMTQTVHLMKYDLYWGCVNSVILALVIYDIVYSCPLYSEMVHMIELLVAIFLTISTTFHFVRYMWTSMNVQPIVLTPNQQRLLGIRQPDSCIKVAKDDCLTPASSRTCTSTPVNLTASSWMTSPLISPASDLDESMSGANYSMSSPSWIYVSGSPQSAVTSITQRSFSTTTDELIQDEQSLRQYLKEYDGFEKSSLVGTSIEQPSNLLSTFWSHPVTRSPSEIIPMLRRCAYQLAPATPVQTASAARSSDDSGSPFSYFDSEIWRRNNINSSNLIHWTANLRMWISQTILERLVSEIKIVDSGLQSQGFVDICIGEVGLDRLRKTAQNPQVVQNIPSLPCLVPFLEVSPNQEYVVSRIRELAKGGSMSEFKWNTGGSFDGKEWGEHLPTDASLVLHLWATYLDSQLPPLPFTPDSRPFSSLYLVKVPNLPTNKVPLAISEVTKHPPHFQLVIGKETHLIPKGRNNLFYTILLFLHHIKIEEHGMLGRMNLGQSGVNMLWVIER